MQCLKKEKKKQYPKIIILLLNTMQMKEQSYTQIYSPKTCSGFAQWLKKKQLQCHEMNKRYIQLSESFEDGRGRVSKSNSTARVFLCRRAYEKKTPKVQRLVSSTASFFFTGGVCVVALSHALISGCVCLCMRVRVCGGTVIVQSGR